MNVLEVKDMDLFIELNGLTTSIIGPSNSGKTVLAKRLCNKLDNSSILIDNKGIKEYDVKTLRRSIAVVLDDNNYINEYVVEELAYYQDRLDFDLEESQKNIDEIATFFKIKGLLNKKVQLIYTSDRILIKILSLLIINPSVFVVDNLLSYLKPDKRSLLFKYVKGN